MSNVFFIIGLISTIAIRVVTILANFNQIYGKIAWYVGVLGFFVFFLYKFKMERGRYLLIEKMNLIEKINEGDQLVESERKVIGGMLCALTSNKDRINYFFIFASSAIVLVLALYYDVFH